MVRATSNEADGKRIVGFIAVTRSPRYLQNSVFKDQFLLVGCSDFSISREPFACARTTTNLPYVTLGRRSQASYGVEDAEYAITQLAQTTMRSEIGKIALDTVFRERELLNYAIVGEQAAAKHRLRVRLHEPPITVKITLPARFSVTVTVSYVKLELTRDRLRSFDFLR